MPIDDSFSALFVPTDAPVRQVQIRDQATIDGLIGGYATSHRLDADTTIFLITHDRKDDLAFNSRATQHVRAHSNAPRDYTVAGPVVLLGADEQGKVADLPQRVIDEVNGLQVTPLEAIDDQKQYVVGYSVGEEGRIEHPGQPTSYAGARFELNDHFIALINADDGFAFEASTAQDVLSELEQGEPFTADVEDRQHFIIEAEGPEQGHGLSYQPGL